MSRTLFSRLTRRLTNQFAVAIGRDEVTGIAVERPADLIHLGSKRGGWIIPSNSLSRESVCYCVGCGEDISFDLDLIRMFGCDVYAFDPTPKSIQYVNTIVTGNPAYHFAPIGLWDEGGVLKFFAPRDDTHVSYSLVNLQATEKYIQANVRRLADIMQGNGHDRVDLLKLDIEGAEYKVIDSILEDQLKINIICVEFDEFWHPLDQNYRCRIRDYALKIVSAGFRLVDFRGNGNYTFLRCT